MLNHREQLQAIRTFPQLVKYLRDELDWPIGRDDFEDISFPYTPEELGIDLKVAAKIQEIRRLRPLTANQPWGIFFIKFEPKRLPVVALRRMLKAVALKKRATADSAERLSWDTEDLLFISNYGEEDSRQITFAQFTLNEEKKDLPTLKVLGWDNKNTALHLDHVAESLATYLTWPDDQNDTSAWRSSWRSAFTIKHREVIDTAKKLSVQLAHLARNIRERINGVLEFETENGPITKLMNAFKEALVHDLDNDGFADMYAQTIAYGLLSARIANPSGKTADDFASAMPVTNPFLKELMETFIDVGGRGSKTGKSIRLDFDELGVSEVVDLLDVANMEAVVRDFGDKNPLEDPVTHFYEQFFADYDNSERFKRGVFYTPRPVVSFIVKSVDEILHTEFGLTDGLADFTTWGEMAERIEGIEIPEGTTPDQPFVQILDPATGTGTFLVEVIDLIHKTMTEKWQAEGHNISKIDQLWNNYVPEHLLPRLYGYELMMAPYAIAHMKIGLKLYETGYRFESDERARVYLTNSLEPAQDFAGTLVFAIPALAHEAEAVNNVKRIQRFTVVIGNPPYFAEAGRGGDWIANLVRGKDITSGCSVPNYFEVDGKDLAERTSKWLNDDYVKFLRLSQWTIERSGIGVLSFITNHSYLDNPTFRGVRQSFIKAFNKIELIDLHGSSKKNEVNPLDVNIDNNVFDIQQGVSIAAFTRLSAKDNTSIVRHCDFWGSRKLKYQRMLDTSIAQTVFSKINPAPTLYLFVPQDNELNAEYQAFHGVYDIFRTKGVGMTTARDHVVIDFDRDPLLKRAEMFRDSSSTDEELYALLDIPKKKGWEMPSARKLIRGESSLENYIIPVLYRPLDRRYIFYHDSLVWRTAKAVMRHMISGDNIGLITTRQTKDRWGLTVTDSVIGHKTCGAYDVNSLFPLYLVSNESELFESADTYQSNISEKYLRELAKSVNLNMITKGAGDLQATLGPEDAFAYIYCLLHSPTYRLRYKEFLKRDFPRVPLPNSLQLFRELVAIGNGLIALHLLRIPEITNKVPQIGDIRRGRIEKVNYSAATVWIDKAKTRGFGEISEEVWNFHIGGYQVCEKWLKDRQAKGGKNPRPGRVLTEEDIEHYQKIIVAISETIRIMGEIDEVIEAHGGWPGAFQTN